ncbi:Putative NACHT nucleoside triphosphatase, P-loop containing nucleoside triphosphate hydrolase [Colletotrichum destructivum]|uniref:NACHT nucleoside triphosphatase, P-loop containing nucleoside triphosphate hydrolase n=1 Tax=Colletotrichum destructivum TaxID=34406 RepID=A0AAX4I7F9_9PEZI|nr:Putative NACHT nucleoside triphosphatase, P-loop containing nucleoside triphosphate hydrolase [Colletotrichum destructivum]
MMSGSRLSLALQSPDKISANRSISPSHQDGNQDGLKHALAVFQATLTDDERAKLQSLKGTSCDADSVITFTADLDRANPARKGRSIATRLFSLLQIVQQFNHTVDTYVSSHPEIAALVWGSVKLAFTVLANFTSYFQQFSELLRGFDRLCPVFAEYRLLFPNSARLRDATYEFHASVICCCSQIMIAIRKPWQQQLLGAVVQSFHGEMKPYVDDVRLRAENVQDEISLAKSQADQKEHLSQAEERRQAAETRKGLAKWFSQSEKQVGCLRQANETANNERKWETLLTKLSSYDYASAFKIAREKRHLGTAEWVFDEAQFQEWYTCEKSSMLHIMGKIGSGKTILTANIVDYLIKHRRLSQVVSFFFVCFDLPESMKCEQILRSLIRQALDQFSTLETLLPALEASNESFFETSTLLDLWSKKASSVDELFIVLDGFDECSATERKAFLNALVQMYRACNGSTRVKTLISSRESIRQEVILCDSACFTLTLGSDGIIHDLSRYVSEIVSEKLSVGELKIKDPLLAKDIIREISLGGEGMFLWVSLTIEDICSRHTDSKIREALDHIPRKLPETFDRALQRVISNGNEDIAQNIFKWTAVVRQPLKLEQLKEALSVEPLQEYSRPDRFVNGIDRLSVWCENLVQIEYSDETVRFSHHSIRKYLLEPASGPLEAFHFDYESADSTVGILCLTYLNFNDFKSALMDPKPTSNRLPVVSPADLAGTVVKSAVSGSSGVRIARLVKRSLGKSTPYSVPIPLPTPLQATSSGNATNIVQTEYPFLEYAKSHWYTHRLSPTTSTSHCKMLLRTMVESEHAPWWDPEWRPPGIRVFNSRQWLDYLEYGWPVKKACEVPPPDFSDSDVALHKAVVYADSIDNHVLLEHLLTKFVDRSQPISPYVLQGLLPRKRAVAIVDGAVSQCFYSGLVNLATRYIARGGAIWPAGCPDNFHTDCHHELGMHQDIHLILTRSSPFRSHKERWLEPFVRLSTLPMDDWLFSYLRDSFSILPPAKLLFTRTASGKGILSIILERDGDWSLKAATWLLERYASKGEQDVVSAAYDALKSALWYKKSTAMNFLLESIERMVPSVEDTELDLVFRVLITKSHPDETLWLELLDNVKTILGYEKTRGAKALSTSLFESIRVEKWDLAITFVSFHARLDFLVTLGSALDVLSAFFNSALECATSSTEGKRCGLRVLKRLDVSTLVYCPKHMGAAKYLLKSLKDEACHVPESMSLYRSLRNSVLLWNRNEYSLV